MPTAFRREPIFRLFWWWVVKAKWLAYMTTLFCKCLPVRRSPSTTNEQCCCIIIVPALSGLDPSLQLNLVFLVEKYYSIASLGSRFESDGLVLEIYIVHIQLDQLFSSDSCLNSSSTIVLSLVSIMEFTRRLASRTDISCRSRLSILYAFKYLFSTMLNGIGSDCSFFQKVFWEVIEGREIFGDTTLSESFWSEVTQVRFQGISINGLRRFPVQESQKLLGHIKLKIDSRFRSSKSHR